MATTKLEIYQRAILHCKQTPVTSLGENNEARRLCDLHYAPMLQSLMEAGFWTHAMRTARITENDSITPAFGYAYVHDIPADFVRKYSVSASETLDPPLDYHSDGSAYLIEGGYLWSDVTPHYLRYTSNDAAYGLDLGRWPERLTEAACTELACRIAPKLTGSSELQGNLMSLKALALGKANTFEALQQPAQAGRPGRWVSDRFSGRRSSLDHRRA
ncbi:MAG: hypothetical protein AAFW74_02150 [Pseudomonadota bacterium]